MRSLELLAPAKNLECGIAAIDHGADAVYIGAQRFGARAAAGNSVPDIKTLCDYAHQFEAKVYVTVNTILYDDELDDTLQLVDELEAAGVDALLVQDMGLFAKLAGRPSSIPLHASTQTDNRTKEKVSWLRAQGFRRVVLARELSMNEIREIHATVPDVELEVFVHGALCVSYSGMCYASQYCFRRSANRGACAQFCRLKFDLVDSDGKVYEHQRHLLSLKDMCQIHHLEELARAGATSFKIEGRLKDVDYVKNVVAAYSQQLNQIVAENPGEYVRASKGKVTYTFVPSLKKTFNRGFTHYFLYGRQPDIVSFDTPKAIGEMVGTVKELRGNSFNVAGTASFANGDGLCFINDEHELEGFRVNRAEDNRLFPLRMPEHLRPGMSLYRNHDVAFEKLLAGKTAERKIPVEMQLAAIDGGFRLTINGSQRSAVESVFAHQLAQKPQHDNIVRQLTKLGNTPYVCEKVEMEADVDRYFIPASILSDLRRQAVEAYARTSEKPLQIAGVSLADEAGGPVLSPQAANVPEYAKYSYLYNIANAAASRFYSQSGLPSAEQGRAFEWSEDIARKGQSPLLMQCRYCLRYALGYCVKRGGQTPPWHEPLYLRLSDGRRFRLQFDCNSCQMNVYAEL